MKIKIVVCTLFSVNCFAFGGSDKNHDSNHIFNSNSNKSRNDFAPANFLRIQVQSSKKEIIVNVATKNENRMVLSSHKNDTREESKGLHLVVLHPKTGHVVLKRRFQTEVFAESIGVAPALALLTNEIIIMAIKYDGSLNLGKMNRLLFKKLGTQGIEKAVFHSYFIWVFRRGGKIFLEAIIDDNPGNFGDYTTSPVYGEVFVPLQYSDSCAHTRRNFLKQDKKYMLELTKFCENYGGYEKLCDCDYSIDLLAKPPELKNSVLNNVPTLIIASNRPKSLLKCLLTVLNQPGSVRENIVVLTDGAYVEVVDLLKIMRIRHIITHTKHMKFLGTGNRIAHQYRIGLRKSVELFPNSKYVIVLEEDLLMSPDFYSYLNQTAELLYKDPSLYCVSAWNDLSALHTGGDPHAVLRMETHPAYGWIVTSDFVRDVDKIWFSENKEFDWDIWFRGPTVRSGRECLVPEVSRSFHLGESGVHIKGQMTYALFTGHLATSTYEIKINNVDRLTQAEYEEDLYNVLESDKVVYLNSTLHPCHSKFMKKNYIDKVVVIFFDMDDTHDTRAWSKLSACFGLFNLDTRNTHNGLFIFYFYRTKIFAIGHPFSDYSYFKPDFIEPISGVRSKWDKENLDRLTLTTRQRFRVPELESKMPFPLLLDEPVAMPRYFYMNTNGTVIN